MTSDLIDHSNLNLATISEEILEQLKNNLPAEAGLNNPIDIIGDAPADRYKSALEILTKDENVNQILVLLTLKQMKIVHRSAIF